MMFNEKKWINFDYASLYPTTINLDFRYLLRKKLNKERKEKLEKINNL